MKIFLGGTCNGSDWRSRLIPMLEIDYFDPVVPDWNDESYQRELQERETSDFVLYVITPKMSGVYSIAEAVDDSNKRPEKTVICVLNEPDAHFSEGQTKSLVAVCKMIEKNGGKVCKNLKDVAAWANR